MISAQALIDKFKGFLDAEDGYIYGAAGVLWTLARQNATTNEMAQKYGYRWIGHHVEDCSGAFTRAFKELGGYMYHGSNTMYNSYCTAKGKLAKGKRTDGNELKPGTAVFVWKEADKKWGHVGLYIGNGEVIEAASTQKGVIKSKVTDSKWNGWGELKGVDYGEAPAPDPDYRPTLRRYDKGDWVKEMQSELLKRGYDLGKWGADGSFGAQTEAALKAFQKDNGLVADGICGEKTWAALEEEPVLYEVYIPHLTKAQAEKIIREFPEGNMSEERG
jgi:hypothetical protein